MRPRKPVLLLDAEMMGKPQNNEPRKVAVVSNRRSLGHHPNQAEISTQDRMKTRLRTFNKPKPFP